MSKWIRIIAFALSSIVSIVLMIVPNAPAVVMWIAFIISIALAIWNMWKNNDFTKAAKLGTKVMHAIKDGKITASEVEEILKTEGEQNVEL